ncbi:peptidoglycan-binding protein LysM [Hyphomonas sp. FCG-A18]|uniref:peptidoglycan-binding protein LysM n=1 Tax=Hyphomonas sp. FCG-A18 TaxID=3080019 RepID=UPI002B318E3F|nr:peptidoglycan-binding protein LysM [Hyphomonas sp. FCG-A18]
MGMFKFVKSKGKELIAERDRVAEKAIRKEVEDLGLDDDLGGDFRVLVDGPKVKIEGKVPDHATKEKIILAAGNVNGIGEVEDIMKVKSKAKVADSIFYTVKSGDSLSKIAKKHYGDAMRYPDIFEANTPMLKHPDRIYPGQVLRIPGAQSKA